MKLDLRFIPFSKDKDYDGHLRNLIVYTHMKVSGLIDKIKEKTDIASYKISLFKEICIDSMMLEDQTLESYGFKGGEHNKILNSNSKTLIYYDYETLDTKDALLNCDYYFNGYKDAIAALENKNNNNNNKK